LLPHIHDCLTLPWTKTYQSVAQHNELGREGEALACEYLVQEGYTIIATNWRSSHMEVDIIAEDAGRLIFVEVKTRSTEAFGHPEESVGPAKQQYLAQTAQHFLHENPSQKEIRFDVISVVMPEGSKPSIHHIADAFFPKR
jgi:putative endonuclease